MPSVCVYDNMSEWERQTSPPARERRVNSPALSARGSRLSRRTSGWGRSHEEIRDEPRGWGHLSNAPDSPVRSWEGPDWFLSGWTGWISLQSKGLSRVFSNTTVQKQQFFSAQLTQFFPFSLLLKPKTILIPSLFILQILVSIKKVSYITSFLTVNLRKGWIWEEAFF